MDAPLVRDLGLRPLPEVWAEMQAFTAERTAATRDEIWFVEHPPVYTLGMRADRSHCSRRATFRSCRSTAAARSRITAPASSWRTFC